MLSELTFAGHMRTKQNLASTLLLLLTIIYGCGLGHTEPKEIDHEAIAQEAIEDYENYRLKMNFADSNVLEFPSPIELARRYKNSGIEFIPGITNPPEKFSDYHTHAKKALNFGVYSADLSYCVMNNQGQCAADYLRAIQSVSEKIGLTELFRYEIILTEFNKNIGNRDSMTNLVKSIQKDLDETLRKDNAQDKAILFYTGAWIETAFIASHAPANFSNTIDTATLRGMSDQMNLAESMLAEIQAIKNKTEEIEELEQRISTFMNATSSVRITNKGDSIILNPQDLSVLKKEIHELRAFIVEES